MAPPVDRTADGLRIALTRVLDPSDVADTLSTLLAKASVPGGLAAAGNFSFGIKGVGRFRVTYITQRGSKVVSIARVRIGVPDIAALTDQTATRP